MLGRMSRSAGPGLLLHLESTAQNLVKKFSAPPLP